MKIQSAAIVPVRYLHETKSRPFHMCLAQFVGVDLVYTAFYTDLASHGKFVLLDNGAAEGCAPTIEELLPKIELIRPHEVVLPDTIYDMPSTLRKAERACKVMQDNFSLVDCSLMAVPQGETFTEWYACARELLAIKEITSIGISKFMTPRFGVNARSIAVSCIRAMEIYYNFPIHDIHLLGCWNHPLEIGDIAEEHNIRSCDSAFAYIMAAAGEELTENSVRPKLEVDFIKGEANLDLLRTNIRKWGEYCGSEM